MPYITIEKIEEISQKLKSLPKIERERRITKREAVLRMKTVIARLQKDGYTLEAVALKLTESGLQISAATLKSYLAKSRVQARTGPAVSTSSARSTEKPDVAL